jgi:hypothetical protein
MTFLIENTVGGDLPVNFFASKFGMFTRSAISMISPNFMGIGGKKYFGHFTNAPPSTDLTRNSNCHYQTGSLLKGATNTTQQGAMENIGSVFYILCLSYTNVGHALLTKKYRTEGDDDKDVSHPLKMFMAMIAWFHQENTTEEV